MANQKNHQEGFTVVELIVVVCLVIAASVITYLQISNLRTSEQNTQRKTAINAMYYALEEVYYKNNQSYPASLKSSTLPSVDPELFTDPDGFTLGKDLLSEEELKKLSKESEANPEINQLLSSIFSGKKPNYHYEPTGCDITTNLCKGYALRADLVGEAEYVKKNRTR